MNYRPAIFPLLAIASLFTGFAATVNSQTCDFLPRAMQPEWTYDSPAIEGYYVGVGLAESDGLGADEQIEQARQSALNDLAGSIKVSVHSSLKIDIREQKSRDRAVVDQDVQQITETIVDTSLKNVEVDATWLDQKRCIVWVRVRVSREAVAEMERVEYNKALVKRLDRHYDQARDSSSRPEERDAALKQAYVLLDEIDFSVIKGQSRNYYRRMLDSLASRVSKSVGYQQEAEQMRRDAENMLLEAGSTNDVDQQKKLRVSAIAKLKAVIAANPIGEREGFTAGEAAAFRIAEIEKARNNPCEAQFQYEIVSERSRSKEWIDKAGNMLEGVNCTRKNRKTRRWRKAFDGIRTSYLCAYDIRGEIDDWDKPCESISSFLQSYGALSGLETGLTARDIVTTAYQLDNDSNAAMTRLADKGRVVLFVAKGKIKHRDNPKNPLGEDHRFSGRIYSYLVNNGKVEFRDKYSGTGGWNPVSEEMAMEVLGLNVAKRWKSKYLKHMSE